MDYYLLFAATLLGCIAGATATYVWHTKQVEELKRYVPKRGKGGKFVRKEQSENG